MPGRTTEEGMAAGRKWLTLFTKQTYTTSAVDKWNRHDQKLYEAVEKGDAKKVSSLLSKKQVRATKTGPGGQSAFHLAASRGLADCISAILSHKVEINAKTDDGFTALHLAVSGCHPECVKLLLQRGAHEDSIDFHSRTPLHCAATSGCVSSVLLLCDAEDTVLDAADDDGRTPLMIAAQRNHPTVCSLLLDRGAQVDLFDRDQKTALTLACEKGNIQAVETLITKGADPTVFDNKGCDALHYSTLCRDEAIRKLVQAALDRRKNHETHARSYNSLAGSKAVPQTPSREQELVNMWKKRYEEEQKRGVWLQGELMMKTHDLERISDEHTLECSRVRDLAGALDRLLKDDGEKKRPKTEDYHIPNTCGLLTRLLEQVKNMKDQQLKERNHLEETIKDLNAKSTKTRTTEELHQEEMRRLQGEVDAAREGEEAALRRVTELEGHLENMREVLSQFEKRKRIQSTVVEDLQDQISEVTREKEELLVLLQKLQEPEVNVDDVQLKSLENGQALPDSNTLSDFIKRLKSNCIQVDIRQDDGVPQGGSGYVPKDVLERTVDDWKSLITRLENYMVAIERLQKSEVTDRSKGTDSVLTNGATEKQNNGHKLARNTSGHYKQIENNIPCLRANETQQSKNTITQLDSGSAHAGDLTRSTDSLNQKVTELEAHLSSLKMTHDNLLTRMNQVVQEKQNLEEGLLALQESMQSEYAMRQETEKRCKDYKHQTLVLSDELLAEQDKLKKLNARLEAEQHEMVVLRDSFPPEIIQEESSRSIQIFSSDILEELYWNVGTLVRKYNDALQEVTALQKENLKLLEDQVQTISMTEHKNILNEIKNQLHAKIRETEDLKQRLFQTVGNVVELKEQLAAQTSNSVPKEEFESRLVDLERIVMSLKEENEACKVAVEGKCEEVINLKQQLEQESEERQTLRLKEASVDQEVEKVRGGLEIQIQALREEMQGLSEKHIQASKESEGCKEMLSSEKEKVLLLEGKIQELMEEADKLRIQSQKYQEENHLLNEKYEDISRASQEKQGEVEESMKEVESLTQEIDQQQKRCEELLAKLEDTNKHHQEIISIYRTHLLNAAQGHMDEDVHLTLHWILKMQNEMVY
ncbi:ankyrin repeat domain-containing protein 35 isoform X2 [Eleutherodactylus coqui]|uniref:ankyrin repeat domain-containing protein 35 isoform X2 n=1 Tax=Eleutherodactylus coqui TaxID=57060 RepID=UPI0034621B3F